MPAAPLSIPASWSDQVGPCPDEVDTLLAAAAHLARTHTPELGALVSLTRQAPPDYRGADGTPLLVALLRNWGRPRLPGPSGSSSVGPPSPVPKFPLPGEPAWDGQGQPFIHELAAATLIARGASPFDAAPDGTTPWQLAHELGGPGLVAQMLRHPHCPPPEKWPLLTVEDPTRIGGEVHWPPLHAALAHQARLVPVLLAANAPLDQKSSSGEPPVFAARFARETRVELVRDLLAAGASPWCEDADGWLMPERWAQSDTGYVDELLLDAWSKRALTDLRRQPDAAHRARFIAAAFHLARPTWLARLTPCPTPAEWAQVRTPHGLNALEWGWLGNALRLGRPNVDTALAQWQASAAWSADAHAVGAWLHSLVKGDPPPGCPHAGRLAFERLAEAARVPAFCVAETLWLLSSAREDAKRPALAESDPFWAAAGNALARVWSPLLTAGKPWPLLDSVDALAQQVMTAPQSTATPVALWRAQLWASIQHNQPDSPAPLTGWPERDWAHTPEGMRLLDEEWPILEPHLSAVTRRHLAPILEAGRLTRQLPASMASTPTRL